MVCLTNFTHASTCPLLCGMLNVHLPAKIFVSHVKFVLTSETIFFKSPYSAKTSLVVCTESSADKLFTFFTIGNLLW